jgi:hypothetical protein
LYEKINKELPFIMSAEIIKGEDILFIEEIFLYQKE